VPHLQDTAALLVTELATNAVLHARRPSVEVSSGRRDGVAVSDTPASPARTQAARREAGTGRGLAGRAAVERSGCESTRTGPYRKDRLVRAPLDPAALPGPEDGALLATA
jgi:hypothetical protein